MLNLKPNEYQLIGKGSHNGVVLSFNSILYAWMIRSKFHYLSNVGGWAFVDDIDIDDCNHVLFDTQQEALIAYTKATTPAPIGIDTKGYHELVSQILAEYGDKQ